MTTQIAYYGQNELPYAEPCLECGGQSVAFTSDGRDLCDVHAKQAQSVIETAQQRNTTRNAQRADRAMAAIRGHVHLNARM